MIDRRLPGAAAYSTRPTTGAPRTVPIPVPPRTDELVGQLERARATYRDGNAEGTERLCQELTSEITRAAQATRKATPHLHALIGAAATLRGLAQLLSGGDADTATFGQAIQHFEKARRFIAGRGDLSADYGIALTMHGDARSARKVLDHAISLGEDSPDVRRTLAMTLLAEGEREQAFAALRTAIERAPNDWQAYRVLAELADQLARPPEEATSIWLGAGRALLAGGRLDEAIAAYNRAREMAPNLGVDDELAVATAMVSTGRQDQAIPHLHTIATAARTPEQLVAAAELFAELGEHTDAEKLARAALVAEPAHVDAALVLGQSLLARGRTEPARYVVTQLLAAAPDDARAHLLLGLLEMNAGRPDAAVSALLTADRLEPEQPLILAYLGSALADSGTRQEALAKLDAAVALAPHDPFVLELCGRVRVDLHDASGAEADLRAVLKLAPERTEARALLGELLRVRGAYDEAEAELDRALADDPGIGWVWAPRGELYARRGDWDRAREAFRRALEHEPHLSPALSGLANALLETGQADDLAEADMLLGTALAGPRESAEAHALLGEVRRRQGRFDEAITSLDRAIALTADYTYALATRGEVLLQADRIDEAIMSLQEAERAGADAAFVNAHLGEAYLSLFDAGDESALHEAVRCLRTASRAAPDNPELLTHLGQALLLAGKDAKALKQLDKAVHLFESQPKAEGLGDALMLRGQALLGTGDPHAAAADLLRAIDLGDDRTDVHALFAQAVYLDGNAQHALDEADRVLDRDDDHQVALAVRGAARVKFGDLERGITDLRAALDKEPTLAFAGQRLREALLKANRPEDAVEELRNAVDHAPDDGNIRLEYARALVAAGDHRLAMNELEELQWDEPENAEIYQLYGNALAAVGRRHDAVNALARAVELSDGQDQMTSIELAVRQAGIGEFADALSTLQRLEQNAMVLTARAYMLADMDRWADAAVTARQATARTDAGRGAYCALGWTLQHGETVDLEGSVSAFSTALQFVPDDPWARKGLANALYLAGDQPGASAEYEWIEKHVAMKFSPRDPHLNALRGWCMFRLRHYFAAVDHLQRAVDHPDLRVGVLFDLLLSYLGLRDHEHSQAVLQQLKTELGEPVHTRFRGKCTVGMDNLRAAANHELSGYPVARTVLAELGELIARR